MVTIPEGHIIYQAGPWIRIAPDAGDLPPGATVITTEELMKARPHLTVDPSEVAVVDAVDMARKAMA